MPAELREESGTNKVTPDLSVIIVPHRTRDIVRDCLASLTTGGGAEGLRCEIIVVDNDSGDGTVEMVASEFPDIVLISTGENVGFSRANNRGIEIARGRQILLLNPDTLVPRGELARCVAFLDSQPADIAAMTCRVESPDGSLQWTCSRGLISPWSECSRALLLDRVFKDSDLFNPERIPGWDRSDTRPVPCMLGAFMLIRRTAMEKIGTLDERFFLMYEDVDWCKRAVDGGWKLMFWPEARITHLGGSSWKLEPIVVFANSHVSAMAYFRKHHPRAVGVVRAVSLIGMELKIALLRLNLLRRPGDSYTLDHLEMARAARRTLRTGDVLRYGKWTETAAEHPKEAAA